MIRKTALVILALLGMLILSYSAFALQPDEIKTTEQMNARLDFLYGSHDKYHAFIDQLKKDVAQENKKAVAGVVKYPLKVDIQGKRIAIQNQQQFIQYYDKIITPKIKQAVTDQQFVGIFANYQGIMFGSGQIWLSGICLDKSCRDPKKLVVRIIAINN
ncbi:MULTISPECIES: hypothetical protein [Commensalibacter]|uniref:Uncharacterized protein n=2 Tax=Commensalibacter TaxID=1079922 RepID=W7E3W8_9PROT|nr:MULTISPECIES: hypothetical protein [Commensalibacter]EUK17741.1 hypothetical protein COMX_07100 [Commensalibacter papalotli (ex Servin-Garciduenas et al. 2014)]CAI3944858.1 unnamed protein product [Commensalibacter papalotli (ex Botero et al. 2024)]CAI3946009.1 unnamed protein product [Commensalibacter papalotli (ex Botero et al. 2024)]